MRSGSTWLQTMLSELCDVVADYELKWKPDYELEKLHVPIYDKSFSFDDWFMRILCHTGRVSNQLLNK